MNKNNCDDCPKFKNLVGGWKCCMGNRCEIDVRNETIEEFVRRLNYKFSTLPLDDLITLDILNNIKSIAEKMKGDKK